MPHNHQPMCCCKPPTDDPWGPRTNCPSCVEHGQLARLNMPANTPANQCPEESPSTGLRCLREAGHIGGHNTTNTEPWPGECPSCHATGNQPHTDYCRSPLATQVTVSANPSPDHEWCGQPHPMADHHKCRRPAGHRGDHETSHGHRWPDQAQTNLTQYDPTSYPPPTQTSQPNTETRQAKLDADMFSELEHTTRRGGRTTTHLRALCRPDLCGQQPTPSQ